MAAGVASPPDWLALGVAAGYAHLVMDARGQDVWGKGRATRPIATRSWRLVPLLHDPRHPLRPARPTTIGASSPTPCARSRQCAIASGDRWRRASPSTAAARAVASPLAAAVWCLGGVRCPCPDLPFLCHFARATEITERRPIPGDRALPDDPSRLQRGIAFNTLSYFDGVNFAARATPPGALHPP